MTLKQHAQSLYELGLQIKELNPLIDNITFKIEGASPDEMQAIADEHGRDVRHLNGCNGVDKLLCLVHPKGNHVTIIAISIPVVLKSKITWELPETEKLTIQPEQTTPLTPFTSEIDEDNEILYDVLGGIKY